MTGTAVKVYDLIQPSPLSLREISSLSIVFELWRGEIRKYCQNHESFEIDQIEEISPKDMLPGLPPTIYVLLGQYSAKCRLSTRRWLSDHYEPLFQFYQSRLKNTKILQIFNNFEFDWDGSIHYVRTAKNMMRCEGLTDIMKFLIACQYCFEDDIVRMWPKLSAKIKLNVDFQRCPFLFYWICRLTNELHRVPGRNADESSVDEIMLSTRRWLFSSSAEYFWNRLPAEKQLRKATQLARTNWEILARYILPKLNPNQLDELISKTGVELVCSPYCGASFRGYVVPTWLFVRNKVDANYFTNLVRYCLQRETNQVIHKDRLNPEDEVYSFCQVWKFTPRHFQEAALKNVLNDGDLYVKRIHSNRKPREMKFLITVLLDTDIVTRNKFWRQNWSDLICGAHVDDLRDIMNICFRSRDEIDEFLQNIMGQYENIKWNCGRMFNWGHFHELNQFLTFCFPDTEKRNEFTRRLLQHFLLENEFDLTIPLFRQLGQSKLLNDIICNAFDSVDLAVAFKMQFVLLEQIQNFLLESVSSSRNFKYLMEFVDIFIGLSDDQTMVSLRERIFKNLLSKLEAGSIEDLDGLELENMLLWCFMYKDHRDEINKSN